MHRGFITFHRKIEDWEWYSDGNTFRLFFHLVLTANHKEKKWKGNTIERGQLITGLHSLSDSLNISVQSLRTSLSRLESTGEITRKSTNKFSIITICNYNDYQDKEKAVQQTTNNQLTSNQQTTNNQLTTNNNVNNDNNDNNDNKTTRQKSVKYDPHQDKPVWMTTDQLENLILHRKQHPKKPVMTKLAFSGIFNQLYAAGEMGFSIDECLEQMSNSSWISFKAEYMKNSTSKGNNQPKTFAQIKDEQTLAAMRDFINDDV